MIYYPIQTLVDAGIRDIMIVTGRQEFGRFSAPAGQRQGIRAEAHQLHLPGRRGRNRRRAGAWRNISPTGRRSAWCWATTSSSAISAKPRTVSSAGIAAPTSCSRRCPTRSASAWPKYPAARWWGLRKSPAGRNPTTRSQASICTTPRCSKRSTRWCRRIAAELEITDVNNAYIREGNMTFSYLQGWWTDAGTFDSLLRAANLVAQSVAAKGKRVVGVVMAGQSTLRARRASSPLPANLELAYPANPKGIGAVIGRVDSPDLIAGVRVQPYRRVSRRPRIFPGSAAHRPRVGRRFPARAHPGLGGHELSRHHQGVSISICTRPIAGRP